MKCMNCRYWTRNNNSSKYGDCSNINFLEDGTLNEKGDELIYYEIEGYGYASFKTGERFGCIHFKEYVNTER